MDILQKLGLIRLPMELATNLSVLVSKTQAFVWFCNRLHLDNVYTTTNLCSQDLHCLDILVFLCQILCNQQVLCTVDFHTQYFCCWV